MGGGTGAFGAEGPRRPRWRTSRRDLPPPGDRQGTRHDPLAYLTDILDRVSTTPESRFGDLLPERREQRCADPRTAGAHEQVRPLLRSSFRASDPHIPHRQRDRAQAMPPCRVNCGVVFRTVTAHPRLLRPPNDPPEKRAAPPPRGPRPTRRRFCRPARLRRDHPGASTRVGHRTRNERGPRSSRITARTLPIAARPPPGGSDLHAMRRYAPATSAPPEPQAWQPEPACPRPASPSPSS